ncbi:MAG: multicopper oxidase domain-containing protein [Geminicoccaceae bacterium]
MPYNQPSGTFWYHAHSHGSVALQVSSGMEGALIVEGTGLGRVPRIAKAKEQIFLLPQIPYDQNGRIESYNQFGPGI